MTQADDSDTPAGTGGARTVLIPLKTVVCDLRDQISDRLDEIDTALRVLDRVCEAEEWEAIPFEFIHWLRTRLGEHVAAARGAADSGLCDLERRLRAQGWDTLTAPVV